MKSLPAEFDRLQAASPAIAPRQVVAYLCTREHLVTVPFAADAEAPEVGLPLRPAGHPGRRRRAGRDRPVAA